MATVYDIEHRPQGGSATRVNDVADLFYELSGLASDADFEFRVRSATVEAGVKTWGVFSGWQAFSTTEPDVTSPVITLVGDATLTITPSEAESWVDPGATATDNIDGDITGSIVVTGSVGTAIGTYTLSYDVTDSAGNAATTVTREVTVADTVKPAITLLGGSQIKLSISEAAGWVDPGATALDDTDGDITGSIVTSGSVQAQAGYYYLTYDVTDASGNPADTVTREVIVAETIAASSYTLEYRELGQAAQQVTGITDLFFDVSGLKPNTSYEWRVQGVDGSMTSEFTAWQSFATAQDVDNPIITLIGNASVTITEAQAATWEDPGATANDPTEGDISADIVVTGSVGTTAGVYTLDYDVTDSSGNAAATVTRTVTVQSEDTEAPVITLLGDEVMRLYQGDVWSDPGVTATDNIDGDISAGVTVTGTVDPATAGSYVLTYNVSDAMGNPAQPVSRLVIVSALIIPTDFNLEVTSAAGVSTINGVSGTQYDLTELASGDTITVRVQGVDGQGNTSDWSDPVTFATPISEALGINVSAIDLITLMVSVDSLSTDSRTPLISGVCDRSDAEVQVTINGTTYTPLIENGRWYLAVGSKLGLANGYDELSPPVFSLVFPGDRQITGFDGIPLT